MRLVICGLAVALLLPALASAQAAPARERGGAAARLPAEVREALLRDGRLPPGVRLLERADRPGPARDGGPRAEVLDLLKRLEARVSRLEAFVKSAWRPEGPGGASRGPGPALRGPRGPGGEGARRFAGAPPRLRAFLERMRSRGGAGMRELGSRMRGRMQRFGAGLRREWMERQGRGRGPGPQAGPGGAPGRGPWRGGPQAGPPPERGPGEGPAMGPRGGKGPGARHRAGRGAGRGPEGRDPQAGPPGGDRPDLAEQNARLRAEVEKLRAELKKLATEIRKGRDRD